MKDGPSPIRDALQDLRAGGYALVSGSEPDGPVSLVVAAEHADERRLRFLAMEGTGVLGVCLPEARCRDLGLVSTATQEGQPISVVAAPIAHRDAPPDGSPASRAFTIRRLSDPGATAGEFRRSGVVTPVRVRDPGVLDRPALSEAAVDLMRLAGLHAAAVQTFVAKRDGSYRMVRELDGFARRKRIKTVRIADLVEYRWRRQRLVERSVAVKLPTDVGTFDVVSYSMTLTGRPQLALVTGEARGVEDVPFHVRRRCFAGDVLGSHLCQCSAHLRDSLTALQRRRAGVLVYVMADRPDDLTSRCGAEGDCLSDMDASRIAAQILCDLGPASIRPLTRNPDAEPVDALTAAAWHALDLPPA